MQPGAVGGHEVARIWHFNQIQIGVTFPFPPTLYPIILSPALRTRAHTTHTYPITCHISHYESNASAPLNTCLYYTQLRTSQRISLNLLRPYFDKYMKSSVCILMLSVAQVRQPSSPLGARQVARTVLRWPW